MHSHSPGFFWQGLLILLPVGLLAGLGILSLRHDRLVAEHEAKQLAQEIADRLAPKLWEAIAPTNLPPAQGIVFLVDTNARLITPPACALTPSPTPFDSSVLNSTQARLWAAAQAPAAAIGAWRDFLASDPPAQFAAAAQYSLGLLLASQGDTNEALRSFQALLDKYPGATGESGLPLEPLARLRLLEGLARGEGQASQEAGQVEQLCSNIVSRPTPLSPEILRRVAEQVHTPAGSQAAAAWQRTWNEQETARELFTILAEKGALTNTDPAARRASWCMADQNWLVTVLPAPAGTWYSCRPEPEVGTQLKQLVERETHIPDYFGVGLDVAGRRIRWPAPDLRTWDWVSYFGRAGGGQKKGYSTDTATNVLASAQAVGTSGLLKASVYLTSPGALFARERTRVFWLASLIAAAATAAGVGFFTAYRAFRRQRRLSELKSNFVSSVSHELRAPIASVRLLAESLEQGKIPEPAKQQEYFRFIRQECRRLSSLVENVLDFSRIEQGRKQYEFEPTDVTVLAEQTVKLMQTYADEKDIRLQLDSRLPPPATLDPPPLLDGKAIQQALINLIDNAIKHSPKGETVLVGLDCTTGILPVPSPSAPPPADPTDGSPVPAVLFWVEDHGEGIPPAEHEKIFERFYRLGSELRRETQGVGIGLSIVKHVVEAHGGRVRVRSDLGQGSRFTIELPLHGDGQNEAGTHAL